MDVARAMVVKIFLETERLIIVIEVAGDCLHELFPWVGLIIVVFFGIDPLINGGVL